MSERIQDMGDWWHTTVGQESAATGHQVCTMHTPFDTSHRHGIPQEQTTTIPLEVSGTPSSTYEGTKNSLQNRAEHIPEYTADNRGGMATPTTLLH